MRSLFLAAVLAASAASAEEGEVTREESAPRNYVALMAGTTLAYRAPAKPFEGPQGDVSPMVGYARFVTEHVALELDVGPTFAGGGYASFTLVPGAVVEISEYLYVAMRLLVPVQPEVNFGFFPGVGATLPLSHGFVLFAEANLASMVGRGSPDLGFGLTLGSLYRF
ncbi:MAG: hypothetical protein QM723_19800 [Myxococcaceae bacterium]